MRRTVLAGLLLLLAGAARADDPTRIGIASLSPNLTELVFALGLGSQLVARSSACDFPPRVTNLPVAGDFGRPNLEFLTRLRPAVILVSDVEHPAVLQRLRDGGTTCLVLSCEGWTNLMEAARAIGRAVSHQDAAGTWVTGMEDRRARLEARSASFRRTRPRPSVYVEIWHDPPMTAGRASFIDDLVQLAGGINAAHPLSATYTRASDEWVLRTDPDAILLLYMAAAGTNTAAHLRQRTGWTELKAVRSGHMCDTIPPDLLLRSGPRCLDGAERLAAWLEQTFP